MASGELADALFVGGDGDLSLDCCGARARFLMQRLLIETIVPYVNAPISSCSNVGLENPMCRSSIYDE